MSIDDATPAEWDRASSKSQTCIDPYDLPMDDPVNAPKHYNVGEIECIDAIKASMTPEQFKGYCKGNALKYLWRMYYKGKPAEDVRKAIWYAERLLRTELDHPSLK